MSSSFAHCTSHVAHATASPSYPSRPLHCLSFTFHPVSSSCTYCSLCLELIAPSQYQPRPLIHLLAFHLIVTLSEKPLLHPLAPLLLEISYSPLSPWSTAINCGISCSCLFSPLECKIYKSVNRVHFAYCCIPSI